MPDFCLSATRFFTAITVLGVLVFSTTASAMSFQFSGMGYHPEGAKTAVLKDVPDGQKVDVVLYDPARRNPKFPVMLGAVVYKIENVRAFNETTQQGPGTRSLLLDFSKFSTPGTYELRLEGTDVKSGPVKINQYLYWDTLKPVVKSFYFQRCGQEVEEPALKVFHAACHLKDANYLTSVGARLDDDGLDVTGGWHNGGDYAKYVTSTALSAARLLSMSEWNAKPFKYFRLDYPLFEPGYGNVDDLHHEIRAGLDWLMVMQRRDGAVYRKVAGQEWPGDVRPEDDEQDRYIYGISTPDTANAAAVWAIAARDFKKVDLGYSVKSLLAAEKAWDFLEKHPMLLIQHHEKDFSGSGEFWESGMKSDVPNRLWAAAELYLATGKSKYHQYFLTHLSEISLQPFSWMNPAFLGISDYTLYGQQADAKTLAMLKNSVLKLANRFLDAQKTDIYGVGLPQYGASSNQEVAERGAALMVAYRLSGDEQYRQAASRLVSYFLGLNPLGQTYITGFPGQSVAHPAHRWLKSQNSLLPGFLVDGPNQFAKDGKTPAGHGAASYVDQADAKAVNEPKLLNNASFAFLLATLNDAYNGIAQEPTGPASPLDFELAPERPARKPAK